jgi:hypothetical protein
VPEPGKSTALVGPPGSSSRELACKIRRRSFAAQVLVLGAWAGGTVGLTLALSFASLLSPLVLGVGVNHVIMTVSVYAAMSMTALAPLAVWAGRAIKRRDSAARMALVEGDDPELDDLTPPLRALIADARLARSAIEGGEFDDDVALRAVWEWLQRLAALPERERRALEDRGLVRLGVEDTLRWTIDRPGRREQGLSRIAEELGAFERGLLLASRGPYR